MGKRARKRGYALKDTPKRKEAIETRVENRKADLEIGPSSAQVAANEARDASFRRIRQREEEAIARRGRRALSQIRVGNVKATELTRVGHKG